jgi:DNA-binding NarL/FixJ family response regulator
VRSNLQAKILLIDDHPAVRSGIKKALDEAGLNCCGEAATRAEAYAQIAHKSPDAVILDLNLPDGSGLDVVQWIRKNSKEMAIVILTMSEEENHLIAAMRAGASSFVKKSAPVSEVIVALKSSLELPQNFNAPGIAKALKNSQAKELLTQREITVLQALTQPGTNKVLASNLFISEATFKTHLSAIYRKLEVENRFGAVTKARILNLF